MREGKNVGFARTDFSVTSRAMFPESSLPPLPPPVPPPLPRPRPPVWSALMVPVVAIASAVVLAGIVQAVFMLLDPDFKKSLQPVSRSVAGIPASRKGPELDAKKVDVQVPDFSAIATRSVKEILAHSYGVAVLILPGQLALAGAAIGAAAMSPRRMKERLGYVRSALPWWSLPILMIATIFFGMLGGMIVDQLFPGRHEVMEMFTEMARSASGVVAVLNVVLLSVVPGFVEESLFRGYVQRRLLERWTPLAAVVVSAAFFAAAHFDPQHVIGIVPVGLWLGVIAWRSGAVWPGIICHASMNAVSLIMMRLGADPNDHSIPPGMWVTLAVGAAAVGLAIFLMRRYPPGRLAMAGATA
jgi:membrane protease YdiL (CAAX protease family)